MAAKLRPPIEIGLVAATVAVEAEAPQILVTAAGGGDLMGLPAGPFDPLAHRTFDIGLRTFATEQTALAVGYVEQLYTFGDRGRHARPADTGPHAVSVGYLALTRLPEDEQAVHSAGARFEPWYRFFPWEDWRGGRPKIVDDAILPALGSWAKAAPRAEPSRALGRRERLRFAFGVESSPWDEEKVLERYELLYEAGLIEEARRDGRE